MSVPKIVMDVVKLSEGALSKCGLRVSKIYCNISNNEVVIEGVKDINIADSSCLEFIEVDVNISSNHVKVSAGIEKCLTLMPQYSVFTTIDMIESAVTNVDRELNSKVSELNKEITSKMECFRELYGLLEDVLKTVTGDTMSDELGDIARAICSEYIEEERRKIKERARKLRTLVKLTK